MPTLENESGFEAQDYEDIEFEVANGLAGAKRSLRVAANMRHARVVFAFPREPWDGIKASDDEKQQARGQ